MTSYSIKLTPELKQQMLNWGNQFNICCFMDNHTYPSSYGSFECLLAAGAWKWVKLQAGNAFPTLKAFSAQQNGEWLIGHFGFDLKQETEDVPSKLPDPVGFPDSYFFVPEHLCLLKGNEMRITSHTLSTDQVLREILEMSPSTTTVGISPALVPSMTRGEYIQKVEALKSHIHRGDCYEINFCQEFHSENAQVNPINLFRKLNEVSPNPFSVFYKLDDRFLLCASPERYLCVRGGEVLSQPIKGTAPRNLEDPDADRQLAEQLLMSQKEMSENVMVVDLVRNDLSRVCEPGSVVVEELFGIYSFPQVHQMISTIKGKLDKGKNWLDAVQASFPMGSMTGAPKKRVLELIENYEQVCRGIFSGAVGYRSPSGDADFNVVIRSILYNEQTNYLSCLFGSGITWYADPEKEYEECLLKAAAIKKVLE